MPDVGVLNLQINDNSSQAEQGLQKLADALFRVKRAVNEGLKLNGVSTQIQKIANVVDNNISGSTISKLAEFGDSLARLKGLGDVHINIRSTNLDSTLESVHAGRRAIEQMGESMQEASDSFIEGFGEMAQTPIKAVGDLKVLDGELQKVEDSVNDVKKSGADLDFSAFDPAKLPIGSLGKTVEEASREMNHMEEMARNAFEAVRDSGALDRVNAVRDSVGEIKEETTALILYNGDLANTYERMAKAEREELENIERIIEERKLESEICKATAKEQQELFQPKKTLKKYTFDETSKMADNLTQLDLLKAQLRDAENAYNKFVNTLGADDTKTIKAGLNVSKLRDKIWEYTESMREANAEVAPANMEELAVETEKASRAMDLLKSATEKAKSVFTGFKSNVKAMFPHLDKLWKQLKRIALRMALRSIIKQFTGGLQEGLQNVYQYSKLVGTGFAPAMDSAATSILQMKNSIGAALAPAIQALIPVLQTIVNWFINLVNYANQFFALINGQQTWTRAIPATTTAFGKQEKAAKKAGSAIKDLLADWDELNIIQSQTSGTGGLGDNSEAEQYLKMFEEVGTFNKDIEKIVNFLKDNIENILQVAKDIGIAILAWKLSNTFLSELGTLGSIIKIGVVFKLAFDTATLWDEAYIKTENEVMLLTDAITTAAFAVISNKLASAAFGEGAGLIVAGLTLSVSAAATFVAAATEAKNESQQKMLDMLGAAKMGIGIAVASAGFATMGYNPAVSIAFGIMTITLTTIITYTLKVNAIAAEKAEAMAKRSFAETGEGGINAQDYLDALQTEFDTQTAGSKLVLDAYVEVPDLKDKLQKAAVQIGAFNQVVFFGSGKLTKEDAESFRANWKIVLETLDNMNTKQYETILAGLTDALNTKNAELRKQVDEIRTTFIMLEQNISAENAELYRDMQDLVDKIASGAATQEDIDKYTKYYHVFAAATETGIAEIEKALKEGANIDFGDENTAVANAQEFVKNVGEKASAAIEEVQSAVDSVESSIDAKKRVEKAKWDAGLITEDQYKERIDMYDQVLDAVKKYADEKKGNIQAKLQEAYDTVFKQALQTPNAQTEIYWEKVLLPLMNEAKAAGYKFPEELKEAFAKGASSGLIDYAQYGANDIVKELISRGITDPTDVANVINELVSSMFTGKESDFEYAITSLFVSHTNYGMSEVQLQAKDLLEVTGWNYLSEEWKQSYTDALRDAFGDDVTREILKNLGVDEQHIEEMLGREKGLADSIIWGNSGKSLDEARNFENYVREALGTGEWTGNIRGLVNKYISDNGMDAGEFNKYYGTANDILHQMSTVEQPLNSIDSSVAQIAEEIVKPDTTKVDTNPSEVPGYQFTKDNDVWPGKEDEVERFSNDVEVGVKAANETQTREMQEMTNRIVTQLVSIATYNRALLNKQWTVAPSTALARGAVLGMSMLNNVTGQNP